ncbi:class I SAM-dependent methyltransferase [Eilatimonas milleporae]|uniref:Methyltransferase family protein n=1 Tax=Eilatimonas milleporae TaxID=911205 RepID=A0A3M0BZ93_9PROT|nr:class I SAM-dependent methyltransferase [Eilatimonas milleporae]RMB02914.1 methyltransferase family protein [Eilatimonas milleporae]
MDDLHLLDDLHRDGARQGPGGDAETRLAIALSGLGDGKNLTIADIGCGSGASTLVLADALDARITAVDCMPAFLAALDRAAARAGVADRITPLAGSMDALPFADGSLDAIWSEGAIYTMGFTAGVAAWRRFLKPGGILAVSELTWLTAARPRDLTAYWTDAYAEVDTAAAKLAVLERHGFAPMGYFVLPEHCWFDNYYRPLRQRFDRFLDRHAHSAAARAVVDAEEEEITLFERHKDHVGYGYYIARKVDG